MERKVINVTFEDLKELDYYNALVKSVEANPYSVDGEPLIYDEHKTLLVAAFIAKDFLKVIHYPETLSTDKALRVSQYTKYWIDLMEESVITPAYNGYPKGRENDRPKDTYMLEQLKTIEFKGYRHPKEYPFIVHVGGDPYVTYWNAAKWAEKAYKLSSARVQEGSED